MTLLAFYGFSFFKTNVSHKFVDKYHLVEMVSFYVEPLYGFATDCMHVIR